MDKWCGSHPLCHSNLHRASDYARFQDHINSGLNQFIPTPCTRAVNTFKGNTPLSMMDCNAAVSRNVTGCLLALSRGKDPNLSLDCLDTFCTPSKVQQSGDLPVKLQFETSHFSYIKLGVLCDMSKGCFVCSICFLFSLCPRGKIQDWRHLWATGRAGECRKTEDACDEDD